MLESLLVFFPAVLSRIARLKSVSGGRAAACLALGLWVGLAAQAQTAVSGAIATSTRWTLPGSPYVVSGPVALQAGVVLTIDPGVVVYMASGASLNVGSGRLSAQGEAAKPVRITSDKVRQGLTPAAGDWGGLSFGSGAPGSVLSNVEVAYGTGLSISGASVTLNNARILGHAGPAITADLASVLTGSGNEASGNQFNAVVIPSGDISGTSRLGLRGIPYLVRSGVLSVGTSPTIDAIEPSSILAGETATVAITGKRLTGATQPRWSMAGLTTQLLPNPTDTKVQLQVSAPLDAPAGNADLSLLTDAGEVTRTAAMAVQRNQPRITSISPTSVYAYANGSTLSITGSFLLASSVVELDGQPLVTTFGSTTQLSATLPQQSSAGTRTIRLRTPDAQNAGAFLTSNTATLTVLAAQATYDPATASTFAGSAQVMAVRIPFDAPTGGVSFTLTSSAPAIATVPAAVTIPAGSRSASFQVQGVSVGETQVTAARAGWANAVLPVAVIQPPVSLAYDPVISNLVGVVVGSATQPVTTEVNGLASSLVGVSVGAHARQLSPASGSVGTSLSLQIAGEGLNSVSAVQFVPADGVTLGVPSASADGKQLTVSVSIDAAATKSVRHVVLTTATGRVPFATATGDQFVVAAPAPVVQSVSPNVIVAGQAAGAMVLRGQNLRDVQSVRFVPAQGVSAISAPVSNADATELTFNAVVDASATVGARTVIVTTAGGESSSTAVPGNTFQISRQAGQSYSAISSPLVGVAVGQVVEPQVQAMGPYVSPAVGVMVGQPPAAEGQPVGPVHSPLVGVVTGLGATSMTPSAGAVGSTVAVVVKGGGLAGVSGVQLVPADGVTVSGVNADPSGNQVGFTLSIASSAPKSVRRVVLTSAGAPVPFLNAQASQFLIAAPEPVIDGSITPQVVLAGGAKADLTVRGRNLSDVVSVSVVPPEGVSVLGIPVVDASGTTLNISVQAADAAVSGPRVLVVTTVSGASSGAATPANTIQVARQTATPVKDFSSPLVGVLVGAATVPQTVAREAYSPRVGVTVGAYVSALNPAGTTKGGSGSLTITGGGLQDAASVAIVPAAAASGVTFGAPTVNAAGNELAVPYQVASGAPSASYRIGVLTGAGSRIPAVNEAGLQWRVLDAPTISSFEPIVMTTGRSYTLVVRGSNLKEVQRIAIEPAADITTEDVAMAWGTDALGEKLTLRVILSPSAATGPRVIRLEYPGGMTSGQSATSNTLNVVAP